MFTKFLKTLLLIIPFFFLSFNNPQVTNSAIHFDKNGQSYDWRLSNAACNGCGSFYYLINKSIQRDYNDNYYFYVYFWSNSFYGNGVLGSSYINDIRIYYIDNNNNKVLLVGPYYFLALPKNDNFNGYNLGATLWSKDQGMIVYLEWGSVTTY